MCITSRKHGDKINLKFTNKKNKCTYIATTIVRNATNAQDWQSMVLYYREGSPNEMYVREVSEFLEKFEDYAGDF